MIEHRYLPNSNRIGVLTSTILLAFVLMRIIQSPEISLDVQLPGFFFTIPVNVSTVMSLLIAGLTATGMDWLLRGHPGLHGKPTLEWWLLPTLTSFVISVPLALLPDGVAWWVGFALSGLFLILVFVAEYVSVDPDAPYYSLAMAGLTGISYTLFFILIVALRYGDLRLFVILPAVFVAAGLTSLRIMHLRSSGKWEVIWAFGIGLVCGQLAAGLHYWPLTPVQVGLMLVGPLYGLTNFASNLAEDQPARRAALEPAVTTALCWGLAMFLKS